MPTMRRSSRAAAAATTPAKPAAKAQHNAAAEDDERDQSTLGSNTNSTPHAKGLGYNDTASSRPNGAASNGARNNNSNSNGGGDNGSVDWSASSSPLSSISTPVPAATTSRRQRSRRAVRQVSATNGGGEDGEEDSDKDSVNELLTKAADAIRDEVERDQLTADDDCDNDDDGSDSEEGLARSHASAAKRRRSAGSASGSAQDTPAAATSKKRRADHSSLLDDNNAEEEGNAASTSYAPSKGKGSWKPGKPGRPPKHISEQRRLARAAEGGGSVDANTPTDTYSTPTRLRTRRQSANQGNDTKSSPSNTQFTPPSGSRNPGQVSFSKTALHGLSGAANEYEDIGHDADGDGSTDDEESLKDEAGEKKIDRNGHLLGGREFICPVFMSPFRKNKKRQYVLTMDCCRFTGARDSYMLFKQHPAMRRVETTQEERDLLSENRMIPKVTRFRAIAMITARTAFREFGARIVKNGRYIIDDYWEGKKREEARYPEGTVVANMDVYRSFMEAHAAGITPGSTRKPRKSSSYGKANDSSTNASNSRSGTPTLPSGYISRNSSMMMGDMHSSLAMGGPSANISGGGMMVNSWVQLEAQQRLQRQVASMQQGQFKPGGAHANNSFTIANALQQQQQQQQQQQLLLPQQSSGSGGDLSSEVPDLSVASAAANVTILPKPVFRKSRAAETAEAAFESVIPIHRGIFSDDRGFVDGTPLLQSLAVSWPKATSLTNKLKQRKGLQQRTDTESTPTPADDQADSKDLASSEDLFGPMAYASGKMAREFNSSMRLWREDNGCTWVDPHTGIRQVPENLQPTTIKVGRLDTGSKRWRRTGKNLIEPLVSFVEEGLADPKGSAEDGNNGPSSNDYPLALLPGQYQQSFPIHQTRLGQTYQQAVSSYHYYWSRQLTVLKQQQQQQQQYSAKKR